MGRIAREVTNSCGRRARRKQPRAAECGSAPGADGRRASAGNLLSYCGRFELSGTEARACPTEWRTSSGTDGAELHRLPKEP